MYNRYITPPEPGPAPERAILRRLRDLLPKEGQAEDLLLLVLLLLLALEEDETELLLTLGLVILMGLD